MFRTFVVVVMVLAGLQIAAGVYQWGVNRGAAIERVLHQQGE
jgi:hypothetical protein